MLERASRLTDRCIIAYRDEEAPYRYTGLTRTKHRRGQRLIISTHRYTCQAAEVTPRLADQRSRTQTAR